MCSEPFERTTFLTLEIQSKRLNCSILLLLASNLSPKHVKNLVICCSILIMIYLAQIWGSKEYCLLNILAVNNDPLEDFP